MAGNRCAIAVLPVEGGDPDRLLRSVEAAAAQGRGDFAEVLVLAQSNATGPLDAIRHAAEGAQQQGCDWLLCVSSAETVVPDIFVKSAPALRLHDAVWGAAGSHAPGSDPVPLQRITRLAVQDFTAFFHLALRWWIGPSHFIRPAVALEACSGVSGPASSADYLLRVWAGGGALKSAHALTLFHGSLPLLGEADRAALLGRLDREPVFNAIRFGPLSLKLPYTGRNPVIERDHTRGRFFEEEELAWLAGALPRGLRIVDAGANTGNHTVFFSAAMEAETVVPIEPDPRASAAIRTAAEANGLRNLDFRFLETAVGEREGRMRPVYSQGGGLGATRLVADAAGPVAVLPLDAMDLGRVDFLKIDVEGMEMPVLAGAAALIARHRPALYIEVLDDTVAEFLAWIDANGYRIEKLFPDKKHSNYFAIPAGPRN